MSDEKILDVIIKNLEHLTDKSDRIEENIGKIMPKIDIVYDNYKQLNELSNTTIKLKDKVESIEERLSPIEVVYQQDRAVKDHYKGIFVKITLIVGALSTISGVVYGFIKFIAKYN
jgi:hypothetical protein